LSADVSRRDFVFSFSSSQVFTARTMASSGDPALWLYSSSGGLLAYNDDGAGLGANSLISVQLGAGTYRLRAGVCCDNANAWTGSSYQIQTGLGSVTTTTSTTTTSTTVSSGPAVADLVSDGFSVSSITLRGSQASDNAVWWTVRVRDSRGRLATSVGGQLCPPGSSYPFGNWCTGATFGRSGSSSDATYQGLFWISPDAPGGDWIPRFDPIPGGVTVVGNSRIRVVPRTSTTTTTTTTTTVVTRTPGAPRNLSVAVAGSDTNLSWVSPTDSGGGVITDYIVEYWARGGSSWARLSDGVSTSTAVTIRNLPSNVYSFRVAAVNSAGIGSFVQSGDVSVGTSTTSTTTTTTVPAGPLTLDSDSLSVSSMVLQSNINSNAVYWTVRVRDPFGGRLTSSQVGARLCPVTSSWPDGLGCTGATANGSGNNVDRTYTFLFLISPSAPTGQWLPRMFGPVTGQPDIVGNARVAVS